MAATDAFDSLIRFLLKTSRPLRSPMPWIWFTVVVIIIIIFIVIAAAACCCSLCSANRLAHAHCCTQGLITKLCWSGMPLSHFIYCGIYGVAIIWIECGVECFRFKIIRTVRRTTIESQRIMSKIIRAKDKRRNASKGNSRWSVPQHAAEGNRLDLCRWAMKEWEREKKIIHWGILRHE